jgi:hypothetical protein
MGAEGRGRQALGRATFPEWWVSLWISSVRVTTSLHGWFCTTGYPSVL